MKKRYLLDKLAQALLKKQKWQDRYMFQGFAFRKKRRNAQTQKQQIFRQGSRIEENNGKVLLASDTGCGKVTDSGYDKFVCSYIKIPVAYDVDFSVQIKVTSFLQSNHITFQEGFGLFIRDTMEEDEVTGYHYSNMVAVGGYYGRWNVYGRCGISKDSIEDICNFFLYDKAFDVKAFQIQNDAPRTFALRIQRKGFGIRISMFDESGRNMLFDSTHELSERARSQGFSLTSNGDIQLAVPDHMFSCRDESFYYLGFLAASSSFIVDRNSIQFSTKRRSDCSSVGDTLFVSPQGSCNGYGTQDAPLDLQTAINISQDYRNIILLPGHYHLSEDIIIQKKHSATKNQPKHLICPKKGSAILDFGEKNHSLKILGNYWTIDGITVTKGMGIQIQGSHNRITNCTASYNMETGILIRHERNDSSKEEWPSYNIIENCRSFGNKDRSECNADGFACKVAAGEGNQFVRCLSYLNADDGFDLFTKNRKIGMVTIKDCQSYINGYKLTTDGALVKTMGNGTGFKLGGSGLSIGHKVRGCTAIGNKDAGFSSNSNPQIDLRDCRAGRNGRDNYQFYYYGRASTARKILVNCVELNDEFDPVEWLENRDEH